MRKDPVWCSTDFRELGSFWVNRGEISFCQTTDDRVESSGRLFNILGPETNQRRSFHTRKEKGIDPIISIPTSNQFTNSKGRITNSSSIHPSTPPKPLSTSESPFPNSSAGKHSVHLHKNSSAPRRRGRRSRTVKSGQGRAL